MTQQHLFNEIKPFNVSLYVHDNESITFTPCVDHIFSGTLQCDVL